MDNFRNRKSFLASAYLSVILPILSLTPLAYAEESGFVIGEAADGELTQRTHVSNAEFDKAIETYWQFPEQSSAKLWLAYSEDYMTKRVVDFGKEQVRVSYQGNFLAESTPNSLKEDIEHFLQINVADAYRLAGPTLIEGAQSSRDDQSFLSLTRSQAERLYFSAKLKRSKGLVGDVLTITINLPSDNLQKRAESIQPMVDKLVDAEDVSSALVMAIIHEENAFNLLADAPFDEVGIKRLARLEKQFSSIEDEDSRQLCVIAAYRVGINEVVRVFTGRTSLPQALPLINQFSSRQVKGQLRSQLTVREGGKYVQQVSSFLALYD